MSIRIESLQNIVSKKHQEPHNVVRMELPVSQYYNQLVFDQKSRQRYLTKETFDEFEHALASGAPIDARLADNFANGLKNWALELGVTHYTHWFHPLTGKTSEKHDTFFNFDKSGKAIEEFRGDHLVRQEPDGSSFPSGGLRDTSKARSYTIWDPTSPPFIRISRNGRTLCIPAVLITYKGESTDLKGPLLKSIKAINDAAVEIYQYFDTNVKKITPTLGWEQEYFVVDESLFYSRPDLVLCGRTLFGNVSARNQQLEDHYFATIPERVYDFIIELEQEALKLGIPIKTRHNEVAPNQFECAPHFEFVNIAADHNQLLMDKIDLIARRHRLRALLHEKPFAGINGSGKHNNWSMMSDTGVNLLDPGDEPQKNLRFLTFFINTIKAVHKYSDVLRAAIANTGNEHRLGANEAPPAIISVFTGEYLAKVLDNFKNDSQEHVEFKTILNPDFSQITDIKIDSGDRNRTSPFPFTGNKFEFRAVGSSDNVSKPMTYLNVIVADQLRKFKHEVDALIAGGADKETAIKQILKKYLVESESVIFNGDNYSEEWVQEASKRGLSNIKSTAEALEVLTRAEVIELFKRNNIYSEKETLARYNVYMHEYLHKIEIEANLVSEIANTMILPAAIEYQKDLIRAVKEMEQIDLVAEAELHKNSIRKIAAHLEAISRSLESLEEERNKAEAMPRALDQAKHYYYGIKPILETIRLHADKLEQTIDDKYWPLPKYREMLFMY